jgi:pimeloyl-ACP methyl ester carboxylesterase
MSMACSYRRRDMLQDDGPATVEFDIRLPDGRTLHAYDRPPASSTEVAVYWHHGSPNIGAPPAPLFPRSDELGIRWISHDRPGYGGSASHDGRTVAATAADAAAVADALGVERFAVMAHSGGGPNALACAAMLPERVLAVVVIAGLAPTDAEGLDWFDGFGASGSAELRAAIEGREALEHQLEHSEDEFTADDHAELAGEWSWFIDVVKPAVAGGLGGFVDDDLAAVRPWGFDPSDIDAPTLVVHGTNDSVVPPAHGQWLSVHCRAGELWLRDGDGHISVMRSANDALTWLTSRASRRARR